MSVLEQLVTLSKAGVRRMFVADRVFDAAAWELYERNPYGNTPPYPPPGSKLYIRNMSVFRRSERS